MKITISFNPPIDSVIANWQKLASTGIYEGIGRLAQEVEPLLVSALQAEAPKRTGAYAGSIHGVQLGGAGHITLEFRAEDPLSTWIIGGTQPHDIYPVNAKALYFMASDGKYHFARHVSHPGTQPNDYPRRAWESVRSEVQDILLRTGRSILTQVAT